MLHRHAKYNEHCEQRAVIRAVSAHTRHIGLHRVTQNVYLTKGCDPSRELTYTPYWSSQSHPECVFNKGL